VTFQISVERFGYSLYYQRFGFVPAAKYRIRWEHKAPREAFMVREIRADALNGVTGVVRFRPEFEGV